MSKNGEKNTNMAFIFSLELVESNPEAYASIILKLKEAEYHLAITSTEAKNIQEIEKMCAGIYVENMPLSEIVTIMVSVKEFRNYPPEPHIFLEASDQMETPYQYCYILTNSETEIRSGLSAGMKIIFISENKLPKLRLDELFSVKQYRDVNELQDSLEIHEITKMILHY